MKQRTTDSVIRSSTEKYVKQQLRFKFDYVNKLAK